MELINTIDKLFHPFREINSSMWNLWMNVDNRCREIEARIVSQYLKQKVVESHDLGISYEPICDCEVIVSLTTYGKRIHDVYLAIESIMQGTQKPNRIILWLSKEEFAGRPLPIVLQNQMKRGLQIEYCEELRSYKKIIPALIKYPDACIVTIDDDLIYEPDLLEHLVLSYSDNPNSVSACRTHVMLLSEETLIDYNSWNLLSHECKTPNLNFLTSGGGTLFPPKCLPEEALNKEVFLSICPTADDVWLNAMLRLNDIDIVKAYTHSAKGNDFYEINNEYEKPLCALNMNEKKNMNDHQICAVFSKYGVNEKLRSVK